MPLPKPKPGEDRDDWIGRCMSDDTMQSEFPEQDQRTAVCNQIWRDKDKARSDVYVKTIASVADVVDVDEKERTVKAKISTDSVDSDKEVVLPSGLNLKRFQKNPTVLFMHDPFSLVGKSLWQKVGKRDVMAKTRFAETPLADEVFQLYVGGFIRGWSVGLDPMTIKRRDMTAVDVRKRKDWAGGLQIIESANMVEYSAVTLPANEDALNRAFTKGRFSIVRPILEKHWDLGDRGETERHIEPVRFVRPVKRSVKRRPLSVGDLEVMIDQRLRLLRGRL